MRMRFWATMRSPAFSISALIAPVRLRAVASGLIIEKVRSIAMISSLKSAGGSCGAYIGAAGERQAIRRATADRRAGMPATLQCPKLQQFHQDEPFLKRPSGLHSACSGIGFHQPNASPVQEDARDSDFTDGACGAEPEETTMLRKLSLVAVAAASLGAGRVGADLRLGLGRSWLARRLAWRMAAAGAGAVPASSSAARPITATAMAAAMCGDWFRRLGTALAPVNRCY